MSLARLALPVVLLCAAAAQVPLRADALRLEGPLIQGGLLHGRAAPGSRVELDGRAVPVTADGRFLLGFGRDAAGEAELLVIWPDGRREARRLEIAARDYDVQRIDGLPESMVTPPPEVLERIRADAALVAAARATEIAEPLYLTGFQWPAEGTISGVYGSQRILNGEPRQPHYGIDIAAPAGSPVQAPADGVVTLAEPDLYYTGGTVILDHGHRLSSTFLHLQEIAVAVGERVARGEVIGTVGSTGRSTGAHLDWRMNWFEERIDPALLVPPMPAAEEPS